MLLYFLGCVYIIFAYILICYGQKRPAAGFVLAPLAPSLIGAIVYRDIMWGVIILPFTYVFALSGIPIYFLFRRVGWLTWWKVTAASAILGVAIAFFIGLNETLLAGCGAATGLTFWLIAFAGARSSSRVNRDAEKARRAG